MDCTQAACGSGCWAVTLGRGTQVDTTTEVTSRLGLKLWFTDGAVMIAGCLRSITVPRTTPVQEFPDSRKS